VELFRPYFYHKKIGQPIPLDAELSLGENCYSDLVRKCQSTWEWIACITKPVKTWERLLGLHLSTRAVDANICADAADVDAYYAQKAEPPASEEARNLGGSRGWQRGSDDPGPAG